ncbi:unnamed protein product [Rhizophagus irregularis]|nr:unnamed protein product [Rhizophagus irregularis]
MHSYNPLEKADTIAIIIQKLPLEVLDKLCWINSTWYKEIQHEFWRRWKIQVLEYYKLGHEEEKLEYPFNWDVVSKEFIERETEIAKKQVEIERYMLHNGMLEGQEKEIVKYNIRQIAKNVVPWWDVDKWKESEFLGFIKKDTRRGFAPKEYNRPFGFGMKQFINKILYYNDETLYFVEDDPI